jgi:hypothetical protein
MQSSSSDVYPNTATFTFYGSSYTSDYIVFKPVEYYSNQTDPSGNGYTVLQRLTPEQRKLVTTYDTAKYFPGSLTTGENGFPFVNTANTYLSSSSYDPSILQGLTREQIASGLSDAKNPITQAIVASANYLTAAICNSTQQKPASVCSSKGVMAAAAKGFASS